MFEAPPDATFPTPLPTSNPTPTLLVCPMKTTCRKFQPFSNQSNLKRHIREVHKVEAVRCPVEKCEATVSLPQLHDHISVHHKFSFRDVQARDQYVEQQSTKPLPSVDPYWRQYGKETPAPVKITHARTNEIVYTLPSVAPTELEEDLRDAAHLPTSGVLQGSLEQDLTEEEENSLKGLLDVPLPSTRDNIYVPEVFQDTRVVCEEPPTKKRSMSKEALLKDYKAADAAVEYYTKKREAIKKQLKEMEEEERKRDKEEIKKLKKEKMELQERLAVARNISKEYDQERRILQATPAGNKILGLY